MTEKMMTMTELAVLNTGLRDDSPALPATLVSESPAVAVFRFGSGWLVAGPYRATGSNVRELAEREAVSMMNGSGRKVSSSADAPDGKFDLRWITLSPVGFRDDPVEGFKVPAISGPGSRWVAAAGNGFVLSYPGGFEPFDNVTDALAALYAAAR